MRSSLFVLLALTGSASADGGYFIETVGGGVYGGDLAQFGNWDARLHLGGGYVRGPWALEASVSLFLPDQPYAPPCPTGKCLTFQEPSVDLVVGNLDVRRAWRILRPRFTSKIGIDFIVHGGPRWAVCDTPRDSYSGPGLGGGTGFEINLRAVSMFVDLGVDVAMLRSSSGRVITTDLPYFGAGMRLGWF